MSHSPSATSRALAAALVVCLAILPSAPALSTEGSPRERLRLEARGTAPTVGREGTGSPAASQDPRAAALAGAVRSYVAGQRAQQARQRLAPQPVALPPDQSAELDALRARVSGELTARFRRGSRTPRYLRATMLEPSAAGIAPGRLQDETTAQRFLQSSRRLMRLDDPAEELALRRVVREADGRRHLRYQQRHRGLEVWPADLVVHLDAAGNVELMNGVYVPTPRGVSRNPQLTAEQALAPARAAVPDGAEAQAREKSLIVYAPGDRQPRLAWRWALQRSVHSEWLVVVDAVDGAILTAFDQVATMNVAGSGVDLQGVTQPLNVWSEGGLFYLTDTSKAMFDAGSNPPQPDTTRGAIIIQDAANLPATSDPQEIPSTVEVVRSSSATSTWIADAVSAASNFSEVYDYFLDVHARNSLDDDGGNILAVVRLGLNFENAFFNPGLNLMAFGDAVPFAGALDVVAHELTHGVTFHTSNLVYQDQSGALNESFSDIFGEMVEARVVGGSPDWVVGTALPDPFRNMMDPSSIEIQPGLPYPEKFSEFIETTQDNGGVHLNSSIVNHAFYQLAEGLTGAIGLSDAERIFFRALTIHLTANSQFIDARLACIQSAEELFGAASAQATKTAEAFDFVEIFDGASTPDPPDFPGTAGEDATLFVFFDPSETFCTSLGGQPSGVTCLGRREVAGDGETGSTLAQFEVKEQKPVVVGDGDLAIFVDPLDDLCLIPTDGSEAETCLFLPDVDVFVNSIAVSPDGSILGFTLLDPIFFEPEDVIFVTNLDDPSGDIVAYDLEAPALDGTTIGTVLFADAMDFSSDGGTLYYDAFNEITLAGGFDVGAWSIYSIDLASGTTFAVLPPVEGLDISFPSLSQTSDNYLTFDVYDQAAGGSTIYAGDLNTGDLSVVGSTGDFGVPGYNGDDSAIVFSQDDAGAPTGFSLVEQPVAADRLTPVGTPALWLADADFGVIYRRGTFVPEPGAAMLRLAALLGLGVLVRRRRRRC